MLYLAFFFYPRWEKIGAEATLNYDVSGYYMYLPAMFIYNDIKHCSFKDSILAKYHPTPDFQQAFIHKKSGNYVMKYAIGQAITMFPFFVIAHTYCKLNPKYPADGFSFPYQFSVGVGMLLYAFLGLLVLRKVLLYYYKDSSVAILLLCYVLGSNYLNYSAIEQAMTHNTLFLIYCLLIYCSIQFYNKLSFFYAFLIGCLVGWATLIRPTDIISFLIPLLWHVNSHKDIKGRYRLIIAHFPKFLIAVGTAFAVFSIQMIYWKYAANEWFVYSYEDQGFSWLHPHILDYCLSYQCGWLRYCPMMILPLIGIILYLKEGESKYAILSFILLNFYIVTAWDVWNYGGVAGRAMVQSYPILAFPFCLLIERMMQKKWSAIVLSIAIIAFLYINVWWTYHAHAGNTQVSFGTKAYYWRVLGRWNNTDEDKKLLDNMHAFYGQPKDSLVLYTNDFSNDTSRNAIIANSNPKIRLNKDLQYTDFYTIKRPPEIRKWVRASASFHCVAKEWDIWKQTLFIMKFMNKTEEVQANHIRIYRFLGETETKKIYLDGLTPNRPWDTIEIFFWNTNSDKELFIDDLQVITFDD